MKSDIEKKTDGRVAAAFEDMVTEMSSNARTEILRAAQQLVKAVWLSKIYAALPADKTKVGEYFLDQELEQSLASGEIVPLEIHSLTRTTEMLTPQAAGPQLILLCAERPVGWPA